jgi:hypothetical protein
LLTTPISYLTSANVFRDPLKRGNAYTDERCLLYEYIDKEYYFDHGNPAGGDWFSRTYGEWRMVCAGPDGWVFNSLIGGPDGQSAFSTTTYDPTNGTVSQGDIYRTGKDPDLKKV